MNNRSQSLHKILSRIFFHLPAKYFRRLIVLFILMIGSTFAEIISISAIIPFLGILQSPELVYSHDKFFPIREFLNIKNPDQVILPVVVFFAVSVLLAGIVRIVLLWAQTRISYSIGVNLCVQAYRKTLYQPYSVHVARNTSEIISGISVKTASVANNAILPLLTILSSILTVMSIFFTLLFIDPFVSLIGLFGFAGIYYVIAISVNKHLNVNSSRIAVEQTNTVKALQEGLGAIRDVLIDGTQEIYVKAYRQSDLRLRRSIGNIHIVGTLPRYLVESFAMVLVAIIAYFTVIDEGRSNEAVIILGTFALASQRMLPLIQQIYVGITSVRGNSASLNDVAKLLDQPMPSISILESVDQMPFRYHIELKNVCFRYNIHSKNVLNNINVSIHRGDIVGIVGATGSGKSTLVDIIMGLIEPTSGSVLVDNVPVSKENTRSWQSNIGHVPQHLYLTDATIAENIAISANNGEIDYSRVHMAAKIAQLDKVVEAWPAGYNTLVGERGLRLSGGQRQRIGIARAIYKQKDLLVLDEATSALDSKTEDDFVNMLELLKGQITILMIAHRITTLKNCNIIIQLDNANIISQTTYLEYIAMNKSNLSPSQ